MTTILRPYLLILAFTSFLLPACGSPVSAVPTKDYPPDPTVPIFDLDRQTLVDIYNGTVNRWNDPKITALNPQFADYLPEAAITVVHRSDASGTTELFTKSLISFSPGWTAGSGTTIDWPVDKAGNGVGAKGNQGVAEAVVNTGNSLGYVELSYAARDRVIANLEEVTCNGQPVMK